MLTISFPVFKNDEFDEDEDQENPDDENLFINMYPHMDILDTEPDGDDNEDSYDKDDLDLHDINHPDYMPLHVQAHLHGPRIPHEIQNLQNFTILTLVLLSNNTKQVPK
jgi:hypothetical protein